MTDCIFLSIKHSCNESLKILKYRRAGWVQRIEIYFIPLKTLCHITYFWKWKEWRRMHNASEMGWTKGIHITGVHAELLVSYWTMYQSAFFKRPTDSAITLIYWPIILDILSRLSWCNQKFPKAGENILPNDACFFHLWFAVSCVSGHDET